jgi:hypothetical protein
MGTALAAVIGFALIAGVLVGLEALINRRRR